MQGKSCRIQPRWPKKSSRRKESSSLGHCWRQWRGEEFGTCQRCRQDHPKHMEGHMLANPSVMGGPKATRSRFTRQPRTRKSRNCTTKKSRAASALHATFACQF